MNSKLVLLALVAAVLAVATFAISNPRYPTYAFDEDDFVPVFDVDSYEYESEDLQATYTVKSGDTLSAIASKYHCTYVFQTDSFSFFLIFQFRGFSALLDLFNEFLRSYLQLRRELYRLIVKRSHPFCFFFSFF